MEKEESYLELSTLLAAVKECVADAFPLPVWVKAEISSWSPRSNGHCYLTLSESRGNKLIAESRAMIWSWKYLTLKRAFERETGEQLQAGITVLVQVRVNYSELYGVSLYIENIDPAFTVGEKALEKKRIIERLQKDGYMDMQKELALPRLPYHLAVITSKTAAGYQDFRNHITQNPEGYIFDLKLFEASMQGADAPQSITEAIAKASKEGADAILILRGGGSETDLSCFDDEGLAIAIAECEVPVVTAIGHDKDVHIADMVASQSVKTPTALADLFLNIYREEDSAIDLLKDRISNAAARRISAMELSLKGLDSKVHRSVQSRLSEMLRLAETAASRVGIAVTRRIGAVETALQRAAGRVSRGLLRKYSDTAKLSETATHRIKFAAASKYSLAVSDLALREARITATDPRNILSLGYVLVTGRDNKVLKTVNRVAKGDRIGVRFADGSLTAKVDEVFTEKVDIQKVNIA